MNRNLLARAVAVVILGILFASYVNHDRQKWQREGRDAFIAHQAERFDRFISPARPFSLTALAIGTTVLTFLLVCLYEVIVTVVSALLKSMVPDQQNRPESSSAPFS